MFTCFPVVTSAFWLRRCWPSARLHISEAEAKELAYQALVFFEDRTPGAVCTSTSPRPPHDGDFNGTFSGNRMITRHGALEGGGLIGIPTSPHPTPFSRISIEHDVARSSDELSRGCR